MFQFHVPLYFHKQNSPGSLLQQSPTTEVYRSRHLPPLSLQVEAFGPKEKVAAFSSTILENKI